MARKTKRTVVFKRKHKGKTNYKNRMTILLAGKPRLVVRKSSKNILVQVIDFNPAGDIILLSAASSELRKLGWKYGCGNIPSAYLVGLLAGKKAIAKKITAAVLDIGLSPSTPGARLYAALKGAVDAGVKIPYDEKILPSEDRLVGKHIEEYTRKAGNKNQFSKTKPSDISQEFKMMKNKILGTKNEKEN